MNDKKRVLKMIEEGKLSAEEAIKILDALDNNTKNNEVSENYFSMSKNSLNGKMLYVSVDSKEDKIKINIPIEFLKFASKGLKKFPDFEKYDIDLEEIMLAIENGFEGRIVDIESENDEKVIVEIR